MGQIGAGTNNSALRPFFCVCSSMAVLSKPLSASEMHGIGRINIDHAFALVKAAIASFAPALSNSLSVLSEILDLGQPLLADLLS